MQWSPQQADALKKIKHWAKDRTAKQVFRVFGFAGTGKTTLAREIASQVGGVVMFMTFTGKAALVLRKKGCESATTIHGAIYKPTEDPITGITEFVLDPDSAVARAALVIVDEVSMVGDDIGKDLLSFGTKILVLGDPFQLPPISGEGFFTAQEPDILLTEIHRQAAESPIIRMSMEIRSGAQLALGQYGSSQVVRRVDVDKDWMREQVLAADQMLCGMNKTRQNFNRRVRELKGMAGAEAPYLPVEGDRLVCLKNNGVKGLLNGALWEVTRTGLGPRCKDVEMRVASIDEPHKAHLDVVTPIQFFTGTEKELDWRELKRADQFTYGYALTVHKSQGSAWDNVLVYDESAVFRDNGPKHLYTAVTRAAEKVSVVL